MRCSLELPDEKRQAVGSFCCGQASGLHIPLEEAQRSYFCRWARRQENEGLCRDSKSSGEMTAQPAVGYNHCHSPLLSGLAPCGRSPRRRQDSVVGWWVWRANYNCPVSSWVGGRGQDPEPMGAIHTPGVVFWAKVLA